MNDKIQKFIDEYKTLCEKHHMIIAVDPTVYVDANLIENEMDDHIQELIEES